MFYPKLKVNVNPAQTHTQHARAILLKKLEVGDFKLGSFSEVLLVYHEHTRYTIPNKPSRELQAFCLETAGVFTLHLILKPQIFIKTSEVDQLIRIGVIESTHMVSLAL